MQNKPLESDWNVYNSHIAEWREHYLARKNREVVAMSHR